jgi:tRNA C32,U32 (ribose-2'-O)-methylase TrmJ
MVATRNPLNLGAAARAMANFGLSRLRVVNPYDVAFREARSAVGAAALLRAAETSATIADAARSHSRVRFHGGVVRDPRSAAMAKDN